MGLSEVAWMYLKLVPPIILLGLMIAAAIVLGRAPA
jgi:hypothetical protein